MFHSKGRIKQTPRTLNIIGFVLLYLPLSIQIVMILTRKEGFWLAVPKYQSFAGPTNHSSARADHDRIMVWLAVI